MKRVMPLLLLLTACQQKPTPKPMVLHTPPFSQLQDVQLGMSLDALAHARRIGLVNGSHYREQTRGFDVEYTMKDNQLDAVSTEQANLNATAGLIQFKEFQQQAFRSLGVQPVCAYLARRRELIAQYPLQREVYEITFQMGDPDQASLLSRSFRRNASPDWQIATRQACVR